MEIGRRTAARLAIVSVVLITSMAGCSNQQPARPGSAGVRAETLQMTGAGSTFGYPIYSKWFGEYNKRRPEIQVSYNSIGSGAGVQQFTAGTVFFGATDLPMTDAQLQAAGRPVLHLPTVIGGVVPIYNLPGVSAVLNFSGPVLAKIFLGEITHWNDPAIAALNPHVTLPASDILVVHRSDGSGTTAVWADYLSKVSPEWKARIGVSTALRWPVGLGGKGSEGVAGLIRQTPGSLGYIELTYAQQNRIATGRVRNKAGHFVDASPSSVTAAAASAAQTMPPDFRVSITDAPGADAYPIASFTWIVLWRQAEDKRKAAAMVTLLEWALTDGQQYCAALGYAPLPASVAELELRALEAIAIS
jgi:phosphate transport system substrate-binding protein